MFDPEGWLQDRDRHDKVGCQDEVVLKIDAETVGRELLAEDVEHAGDIFRPLVDDVVVGIRFDETTRR